jgi:hypothetical protein
MMPRNPRTNESLRRYVEKQSTNQPDNQALPSMSPQPNHFPKSVRYLYAQILL